MKLWPEPNEPWPRLIGLVFILIHYTHYMYEHTFIVYISKKKYLDLSYEIQNN